MRKFLEIFVFILISITLGVLISVPLFFFSTSEDINIEVFNLGDINLYKIFVISIFIIIIIYLIIRKAVDKFRQDKETRKFILKKYPPVLSHFLVFISQIIPSLIRFRPLIILILIAFGIPRLLSFWINNNIIGTADVTWIDIILNILIIQLIIAPIATILLLNNYFDRERINSVDDYSTKNQESPKDYLTEEENHGSIQEKAEFTNNEQIKSTTDPKSNKMFFLRLVAGLIDFVAEIVIIAIIIIVSYLILDETLYARNALSGMGMNTSNITMTDFFIIVGIVAYILVQLIKLRLFKTKLIKYSIGKSIMKLKVVDVDQKKMIMSKFFLRETLLKSLSGILIFSWYFFFIKKDGMMLHDYLVGTKVIRN